MAEQDNSADAQEETKSGGSKSLIIAAVVGTVLGVGAGAFVAPKLIASSPPAEADGEDSGYGGGYSDSEPLFSLSNVVVNPPGSDGNRFLIVTFAVGVPDEDAVDLLRSREVELRDGAVSILEQVNMRQLVTSGARDTVRSRFQRYIADQLHLDVSKVRVYLPQFVMQ